MGSIFGRLDYVHYEGTGVSDLSEPVLNQMKSMPPLLKPWQQEDMKNNNVSDYYKNPVANTIFDIWGVANSIPTITHIANTSANTILPIISTLTTSLNNFYAHTNRMSGLGNAPESDPSLPTLKPALGVAKMVMYITYQTDGVQNNAPMMGCFSSLHTNDDLVTYYNTIENYYTTIATSIVVTTDPGDIETPPSTSYSTNLSPTQIAQISTNLSNISTFMDTRRTADVNFYYNSKMIADEYNDLKTFNNMGQAQSDMVNNLIGSDKLLTRLNS